MEKVVGKLKLGEESGDLSYWLTKTPEERLTALEEIRDLTIRLTNNGIKSEFQRVCTII
ncbi:MAG: toxin secretion, membrane fusion protein [Bacteroidia bacterium]